MLPGFRFLFAATMLSMSVLIFGLGAAALLRAAHEEVASNPSWRAAPEMTFAPQPEASRPVLAMLRVDMPPAEKTQDAPATDAPAEQAAITLTPNASERIAALKPEEPSVAESAKAETAKAEIPVAENLAPGETAAAQAPSSADETKVATIATNEVASRENQPIPPPSEQMGAQVAPAADIAATDIATLGGPPVSIETPRRAKVRDAKRDPSAKPDQSEMKKRQQARRAAQRRRIAARARVAAQALAQPASPFGQPAPTTTTTTVRTR
jgi:hypothetical protein